MLEAVFNGHSGFIAASLALVAAGWYATWRLGRGRVINRGLYAAWTSAAVAIVALTMWSTGGTLDKAIECVVNKDVLEPLRTTQGRLNAGMFVPFGVLGVLATRRYIPVLTLGLLLSAAIETVQSLAPFVSRICDTSDFVANSIGTACGVALGALITRWDSGEATLSRTNTQRVQLSALAGILLIGVSWAGWITPRVVERTITDIAPSSAQRQAVAKAVQKSLGRDYSIGTISFITDDGENGSVLASLNSSHGEGAGAAELSWPNEEQFTVNLIPSQVESGHALTVPGATGQANTAQQALSIATAYAERHASWALIDSKATVTALDDEENIGWMISWRRWSGPVLMPMRLDIQVEPSGRITDLILREIADPKLPRVRYSEEKAWSTFSDHFELDEKAAKRSEPTLLAVRRGEEWGVDWLLGAELDDELFSASIDAMSGEVRNPSRHPRSSEGVTIPSP